jgi:hypothetical protein
MVLETKRKEKEKIERCQETRNLDGLIVIGDQAKPKPSTSAPGLTCTRYTQTMYFMYIAYLQYMVYIEFCQCKF